MLKELRTNHRTIIQMKFSGFTNNEIAEKTGMAPATVSQIIRSPLGEAYLNGLQDRAKEDILDVRKKLVSLNKDALKTFERLIDPEHGAAKLICSFLINNQTHRFLQQHFGLETCGYIFTGGVEFERSLENRQV